MPTVADTTDGEVTNRAHLSTESEKVHRLLPAQLQRPGGRDDTV